MVAFIGNTLRGKVSGENFDESIASCQNSSDFSPIKILRYTVTHILEIIKLDCGCRLCIHLIGGDQGTWYFATSGSIRLLNKKPSY